MKKKILTCCFFYIVLINNNILAQVSINHDGTLPDNSAMLDVKSDNKGFLPPRVALQSTNSSTPVISPAAGLLIYNTATAGTPPWQVKPGYYFWSGSSWIPSMLPQGNSPGEMLYWNGSQWVMITPGLHGDHLCYCNGIPTWGGCTPLVSTNPVTAVTQTSAISGGEITSDGGFYVSERGVCWSLIPDPTVADNRTSDGGGTGSFTSMVSGLNPGSGYYLRAYAINMKGVAYGNTEIFQTEPMLIPPSISTGPVTGITPNSATGSGHLNSMGFPPVLEMGICWNTLPNPTLSAYRTSVPLLPVDFSSVMAGLTPNTTYFVRAYATWQLGEVYGDEISFQTTQYHVLTSPVTNITETTAACGGNVLELITQPVISRGVCWSIDPLPDTSDNHTIDGSGQGSFVSNITGLGPGVSYYTRAYATTTLETFYGGQVTFSTLESPCPGLETVVFGGQTYHTVQIGSQCWFKENLNVGVRIDANQTVANNGVTEKYCFNDLEPNCAIYGGLYPWDELMQYVTVSGAQGICPPGWHVPAQSEISILAAFLGGPDAAGGKMKEAGLQHWSSTNSAVTNTSGFTALGSGIYSTSGYTALKDYGRFWTSTVATSTEAAYYDLNAWGINLFISSWNRLHGYAVRCIKDIP